MRRPVRVVLVMLVACVEPLGQNAGPEFEAAAAEPAILLIAGDIARCGIGGDEATAAVLDSLVAVHPDATVVPNGDLVYPEGTAANFANCYDPTWGRHQARSRAVAGNHEYDASPTAQFYFDYWNGASVSDGPAGPRGKGYYSWDVPGWHIVALNTNSAFVSTKAGSPQDVWLAADLQATAQPCIIALFHHPRFYSPVNTTTLPALSGYTLSPWQRLTAVGADLAVNANQHYYERFAPQLADGTASPEGMRQIIAGTGGASGSPLPLRRPNSEVWASTRGILKLELGEGFYRWEFVPAAGKTFTDQGQSDCHRQPPAAEPPPPDTLPPDSSPVPPVDSTPPPPPPAPEPPAIRLTLKGERRSDGKVYNTLDWTGALGANVNVHRNGAFLTLQLNDGHYTNSRIYSGPVTYTYQVCELESAACSNEASVAYD